MSILFYLLFPFIVCMFVMMAVQLFFNINIMGKLFQRQEGQSRISSNNPLNANHNLDGDEVAAQLKALEEAQSRLRTQYPVISRMLGAYLHGESLHNAGGVENAVKEMVLDWRSEKDAVISEIARILANNPDEQSVRAIIISFCDVSFEEEGYRAWLVWLQGQFNDL